MKWVYSVIVASVTLIFSIMKLRLSKAKKKINRLESDLKATRTSTTIANEAVKQSNNVSRETRRIENETQEAVENGDTVYTDYVNEWNSGRL